MQATHRCLSASLAATSIRSIIPPVTPINLTPTPPISVGDLKKFKSANELYPRHEASVTPRPDWRECFIDKFGRFHDYLRVSITERCNLRCRYCMPAEGVPLSPDGLMLKDDEVIRFVRLCVHGGVRKVRLTGGEPTVRKEFSKILEGLGSLPGISTLAMTTNGIVLGRYLQALKESKVNLINLSLDTLIPAKFEVMSRRKGFNRVWEVFNAILAEDFCQLKINCVVMKGFNDDEIVEFVGLTEFFPIHIRFIEFMPFDGNSWTDKRVLTKREMIDTVKEFYPSLCKVSVPSNETADLYHVPHFKGFIGFISSMSEQFCGTCNRLRLTADGNIKNCLFGIEEFSVRDCLRSSVESDEEVMKTIRTAVAAKAEKHGGMYTLQENAALNRAMVRIGG